MGVDGYAPKRIPEEPSITGLVGILRKKSTLSELCILNFADTNVSQEHPNKTISSTHLVTSNDNCASR